MKTIACGNGFLLVVGTAALLLMTVSAAPVDPEEDQSENMVLSRGESADDGYGPWDSFDAAALHKLLMQLDSDDRYGMGRVSRSPGHSEPRGWLASRALRPADSRQFRQWRTDKRQVRFRQCYFNPISCFRK